MGWVTTGLLDSVIGRSESIPVNQEQLAAVHATPAPSDLRALAAEMRAKLEALG